MPYTLLDRIYDKYTSIGSLSTDKGFSTKESKALIEMVCAQLELVMHKKGKRNQQEEKQEKNKTFRKLDKAHNA